MEIAKTFEPSQIEKKWYDIWEREGYFAHQESSNAPAYCIQLPPPNVTGTLHMGHAFQQTIMDSLIRYHRMLGDNTNWVIGTDHAGIATQIVVERQLEMEGKTRLQLGRHAFLERVNAWKQQSGTTITRQMRRLGASGNWQFADADGQASGYFTMDALMSKAVVEVFVRLFKEGLLYRGKRLVNWDPILETAVSDLEVDSEEEDGKIWEISYPIYGTKDSLVVATTRPETLLGDTAVAVNPNDDRYTSLVGQEVVLPITGRLLPIIADEHVDKEFGTGCVKVTPGHDFNDYQIGVRHNLPVHSILTSSAKIIGKEKPGTRSDLSGTDQSSASDLKIPSRYWGIDRFEARKLILQDLAAEGRLQSERAHKLRVPRSARTNAIVEPMLTNQWFVKTEGLAKRAIDAVASGEIQFFPNHWASTYNHWLENIQDWCVSRQLWWGHQIPAWFGSDGEVFVARSEEDARALAQELGYQGPLRRDEDVLDTWFSSALVPFTSLGWPKQSNDLERFLPSSVLVTGFDIIFFWVARMVMMTLHFTNRVPFRHVYINAIVRDADGQKMSKSKGNTIDPLDIIDGTSLENLLQKSTSGLLKSEHREKIEKYVLKSFPEGIPSFGTDALRFTFASLATFSRTLNFDLSRCEGYRHFCNKLWNASRFVLMNAAPASGIRSFSNSSAFSYADRWIRSAFQRAASDIEKSFAEYRFDHLASTLYRFVWEEFCDWYLELAKAQILNGNPNEQAATRKTLVEILEATLRLAHPIIPFITEEIWQKVAPLAGNSAKSIMLTKYPKFDESQIDLQAEARISTLKAAVVACRNLRAEMQLSPAERVPLLASGDAKLLNEMFPYLRSMARLSETTVTIQLPEGDSPLAICGELKLMLVVKVDRAKEIERLMREITKVDEEIRRSQAKLSNSRFTERAPKEVVDTERARLAGFESTVEKLRQQLQKLQAT
jgi:valyl-tRNA synthetase